MLHRTLVTRNARYWFPALLMVLSVAAGVRANQGSGQSPRPSGKNGSNSASRQSGDIEGNLKQAVALRPDSFEANHRMGEFYLHAGRLKAGIPYLEKAQRLNPAHYVNGYDLALAYLETGDLAS